MRRDGRRRGAGTIGAALVVLAALVALGWLAGCGGDGGDGDDRGDGSEDAEDSSTTPSDRAGGSGGVTAEELCDGAAEAGDAATVAAEDLTETSGIAASRQSDGVVWAHNDSGGEPEVFAIGPDGSDRGRVRLDGAEAFDWEDMALGAGPGGADHLYLGDIGDNDAVRDEVVVYRLAEPAVPAGGLPAGTTAAAEVLTLTYADGPRDAETLLADPSTGDLFVVGKTWDAGSVGVYRIPADAAPGNPVAMERVGEVPALAGEMVTGGDVSVDGSLVALRTYFGVQVWDRGPGQTVADALAGEPCEAPAPLEVQGEALAFTPDGRGYVTIAEGGSPRVHRFHLPD
jgi:hypothetical protein